eukprot:gene15266-biopygen4219
MSRGACSRAESSWKRTCRSRASRGIGRFDSSSIPPPRDMSSSETGPCYGEIEHINILTSRVCVVYETLETSIIYTTSSTIHGSHVGNLGELGGNPPPPTAPL